MAGKKRYSVRQVREAMAGTYGNKSTIAKNLGCTRETVDNYLKKFPFLVDELEQERGRIFDMAQDGLVRLINEGMPQAIFFALERLGKPIYARRTEVTGRDGEDLVRLSPDVVGMLRAMGVEPSKAVSEFEALIRAQASAES